MDSFLTEKECIKKMNEPVGSTPKPAFPPHISASWLQAYGLNYAGFIVSAASEAILELPHHPRKWTFDRKKKKTAEYRAYLMRELWKHYSSMK
jgi:hypothetical protein